MANNNHTPEQRAILRKLKALNHRYSKALAIVNECEIERGDLYLEARALTPPVTFRDLADVFGVTEAAVMQKVKRHSQRPAPPQLATVTTLPTPELEPAGT